MGKHKINKKDLKLLKKRKDWKENRVLIFIGIALFLTVIGFYFVILKDDFKQQYAYKKYIGKNVPNSTVCMFNNIVIYQQPVRAVVVQGMQYRGCCPNCRAKLLSNFNNALFATDPYLNIEICKADAYIVLKEDKGNEVLYFASKQSYLKFVNN